MVRPLDLQQVIIQSNPVEKIQQAQQKHPEMQQRQFDLELKEEKKIQKEKPGELKESEHALVRREDEKRRDQRDRDMKRREDSETAAGTEEGNEFSNQGMHIDVKV